MKCSMTKGKLFSIIFICLMAATTSLAGQRTEREMLSVAQRQLSVAAMSRGKVQALPKVERLLDSEHYCIYGNSEAGFVVVSRNDAYPAVMGYSSTPFDTEDLPCGMKWWLETVSSTMQQGTSANRSRAAYQTVEPLVTTTWGQGAPYNFTTPEIGGSHAPTGCVATAMAQLMKYYNYPSQGKGKGYYTRDGNSTHVPENISTVYEWEKMLDSYRGITLTEEIGLPVARLMSDAGIATYMDYGSNSSGALEFNAARGFVNNFSYELASMRCYQRAFYTDEEWMALLYGELSSRRPVLYCGADPAQGGHAFVIDGIDDDGLVHVNWGWDGDYNGFYDIADLNPHDDRYNTNEHFNESQSMVFGLKAQEEPDAGDHLESLWNMPNQVYTLTGGKKRLSINMPNTYNYHFLEYTGTLFLVLENLDDKTADKQTFAIGQPNSYITLYGLSASQMFLTTKLPAGRYMAYVASKCDTDADYQPVRCKGGIVCYEVTAGADGNNVVSEATSMDKLTAVAPVTVGSQNTAFAVYDLQGRRVPSSGVKGIYVKNGRKVVAK